MTQNGASPTRRTRAAELLARVLASGPYDRDGLSGELAVTPAMLDEYISDQTVMPLERQLCLALLVIERVPSLSRSGHMLRGQVRAALAFQERATSVHLTVPPEGPRSF